MEIGDEYRIDYLFTRRGEDLTPMLKKKYTVMMCGKP
jgi:hypothetical protein